MLEGSPGEQVSRRSQEAIEFCDVWMDAKLGLGGRDARSPRYLTPDRSCAAVCEVLPILMISIRIVR
eukprot:766760-Hanusia_phi.AAC.4